MRRRTPALQVSVVDLDEMQLELQFSIAGVDLGRESLMGDDFSAEASERVTFGGGKPSA